MHIRTIVTATAVTAALAAAGLALGQPANAATVRPAAAFTCHVDANNVNYRTGPGTQYPSLGQVNNGFAFPSNGAVQNPANPSDFWETYVRPGRSTAYISTQFVSYCE
jgi:uncharacterized protein YraI